VIAKYSKTNSPPYIRLAGFYFCYFAALGALVPYWNLYLATRGFNAEQIGVLGAILVGTKMLIPNLWGWLADRSGQRLRVIRWTALLAASSFAGFLGPVQFSWYLAITLLFSLFWNAPLPQFEALTLAHLQHESHRYSLIRLWGSLGFITTVLLGGYWLDHYGTDNLPLVLLALLGSVWLMALITPAAPSSPKIDTSQRLTGILRQWPVWSFFLVTLLMQIAHGPYYVFYSIHLQAHGYSPSATGALWTLGVAAEIVLFLGIRPILRRVGLRQMLLISAGCGVLRWLLIAWEARHLAALLIAQSLHAATFGAAHAAAIHLIQRYFGTQYQGQGQALYSSLSYGVGGMLGSLYSGWLWERAGAAAVFSCAALFCMLAFTVAWIGRDDKEDPH